MTPERLMNELLELRGITGEARDAFLFPKYEAMYDPYLMHDMEIAVKRIITAIKNNEKICIYSDYDADGVPGGVILHDFFKKIGYENFYNYIPHRHTEGYGLHKDALVKIKDAGTRLVITVDLGITAVAEVEFATALGIDVIVTDHHEPLDVLPNAIAIVNPKLGSYPDRMLCGAGVAFKLIQALLYPQPSLVEGAANFSLREVGGGVIEGWEKWLLDMAGIATLSDMVPLVNENRIIAYYGMKVLQKTPRPGLQSLFQKSGISLAHLTEEDIVFSITPRLNAASRMAHPDDAFNLLATKDRKAGMVAAEHLSKLNDDRKKIVARIMKEVHKRVQVRQAEQVLPKVFVMGDLSWPAGILGLVASKIVETYQVTTFVWGSDAEEGGSHEEVSIKGSCRGMGDVPIVALMQKISHLLVQFGGHEDAGGFTATKETIHFVETACNEHYDSVKHDSITKNTSVVADLELGLDDITIGHYRSIRQLAPFGMANEKPIFSFKNIKVVSVNQFGKTKEHLEVKISSLTSLVKEGGMLEVRAISWFAHAESFTKKIVVGETIELLAEFDYSVFRGKEELRLKIRDVL